MQPKSQVFNHKDMAKFLSERFGLSEGLAAAIVYELIAKMRAELLSGKKINLRQFCTIKTSTTGKGDRRLAIHKSRNLFDGGKREG